MTINETLLHDKIISCIIIKYNEDISMAKLPIQTVHTSRIRVVKIFESDFTELRN